MSFTNERRILSELDSSTYNAMRSLKEAMNHGAQFQVDFAEIYLTLARARGQCEVLSCKLNAFEDSFREPKK